MCAYTDGLKIQIGFCGAEDISLLAQQIRVLHTPAGRKALATKCTGNTTKFRTEVQQFLAVLFPSVGFSVPIEASPIISTQSFAGRGC